MLNLKEIRLKKIISDVVNGVSKVSDTPFRFSDFEIRDIFVKHFNLIEQSEVEEVYEEHYNRAIASNIHTEKQQVDYLIENDLWDPKEDQIVADKKFYLAGLRQTKSAGALLKSHQEEFDRLINGTIKEISDLESKKAEMIGDTAESLATRRTNDYYIFKSVFKDRYCKNRLLTTEDFDELDSNDIYLLNRINLDVAERLSEKSLKQAAVSAFFMNFFSLTENNPLTYFGKPCSLLTFYQIKLFGLGCYFKNILGELGSSITDDLLDDPDKLVNHYEANRNAQRVMDNSASRAKGDLVATSIPGMTKEDQKDLGLGGNSVDLAKIAKEKGGRLGIREIMEAHGQLRN